MKFEDFYNGIKKAVEFEEKYQYIDFIGKTTCFSDFILKSLNDFKRKLSKIDKGRVDTICACFYQYRFDSISGRMNSIKMPLKRLKLNLRKEKQRKRQKRKKKFLKENLTLQKLMK